MYLISTQEFNRAFLISNVNEQNTGINEQVNAYINSCVPKLLTNALGTSLFNNLNSQITNGELNNDADQKWKDLVGGVTYTKDGKDYIWKGLVYQNGLFKESLLTPYVWCEWYRDNITTMAGVGQVQLQAKNADVVNPLPLLVKNWNTFLEMYQGGFCNSSPKEGYVNGVYFVDYYNGNNTNNEVTLIQFLKDNPTNYPDANCYIFTDTTKSNRFSI